MTTCLRKNGLLCVSFVNVYQFCVCVLLSPLVFRMGCGIRLYLFLIIAFRFTLVLIFMVWRDVATDEIFKLPYLAIP